MAAERTVTFSQPFMGLEPLPVQEPAEENPDVDRKIEMSTFELITLLESIKGKDFPRTIFIAVHSHSVSEKYFPGRESVVQALSEFESILDNQDPDTSLIGEPYYDVLGVAFWDPEAYISPYLTLFPAPKFVRETYKGDYSGTFDTYDRMGLVSLFLEGAYADRVVMIPRIKIMGGTLDREVGLMLRRLLPEKAEGEKGILPGESIFDLAEIPDDELIKVGIPVYRLGDGEIVKISSFA